MGKKTTGAAIAACAVLGLGAMARACPQCRPLVKSGIYNGEFAGNLLVLLLPIAVLLLLATALYFMDSPRQAGRKGAGA